MTKEEIIKRINDLPKGGITTKKIKSSNGKTYEYYFLQWSENGKFDLKKANVIAYSHGEYYGLGEYLGKFGYSVKKKKK